MWGHGLDHLWVADGVDVIMSTDEILSLYENGLAQGF